MPQVRNDIGSHVGLSLEGGQRCYSGGCLIDSTQENKVLDEDLMGRFRSGDEEAFQVLFNRYATHLINFAHRLLRSREDSEDIAQETLLRVYRGKDRYDPSRPFRPWLFSIVVRLTSNRLRDRKRHPQESLDWMPEGEDAPHAPDLPDRTSLSPEQSAEKHYTVLMVQRALDALPENQRAAVLLSRFEEMSYEEIAQVMDTSASSVKSLLFRARQALKESLSVHVS